MHQTMSPPRTERIVIATVIGLALLVAAVVLLSRTSQPAAPSPQWSYPATFTWEGTTWDCGQVDNWNSQYGAYEPDGTPIPEEVVLGCDTP